MKRIITICTLVFAALAMQSCTATFHASHRYPGRRGHVEIHVDHPSHHRKHPGKSIKRHKPPRRVYHNMPRRAPGRNPNARREGGRH